MQVYVASNNAGKLEEMRSIFAGSPLEVETYPNYASPPEDADDYLGNATLKARALRAQLAADGIVAAVLADDSGLEVDAIGGRPGIYSARYAGVHASWEARRAALLQELAGVPPDRRGAQFVCAMVLILLDGSVIEVLRRIGGSIVEREEGDGGFGYDPIFFYPPRQCTFAQLSGADKNVVSHRRAAADALLADVRARG